MNEEKLKTYYILMFGPTMYGLKLIDIEMYAILKYSSMEAYLIIKYGSLNSAYKEWEALMLNVDFETETPTIECFLNHLEIIIDWQERGII